MVGLILIWGIGILWGLVVMIAGIMLSSNLVKKRMEQRLFDRSKKFFTSSYASGNQLWDFGGIVLVKADDKKQGCIAPEGNWKNFVVLNFSEYMTDNKKEEKVEDEKVAQN